MAIGLLAKLLMTQQLRFENGLITLKNIHMCLLPSFFIGELTRYFYEEKRMHHLYLLSWMWGFVLVKQIKTKFKLNTPAKIYSLGMDLTESMGIGLYKTHDYFPGKYTHFKILNNPYLEYVKNIKTKEPIDYFISGFMAGGGCYVHNSLCQNIELKCIIRGDKCCDFLTGTEKELKKRGLWMETKKRYKLDKIYPIQKKFYKNYSDKTEAKLIKQMIDAVQSSKI